MAENDMHYNQTPDETGDTSDAGYDASAPAFPEEGYPADNNSAAAAPAIPLPETGEGLPADSGMIPDTIPDINSDMDYDMNTPAAPLPMPGEGGLTSSINTSYWPVYPNLTPSAGSYGQVRFLNASTNTFPVNITVDNSAYAINSRFGTISNYDWISDGFHTVTVSRATGLRTILLQQTFPFTAGEKVTMVLTDSAQGGLELVRISDTGCHHMPYNSSCYRFANMTYAGSRYDLRLYGGETVFRNVAFQNVSPYKQTLAGMYQFYVTSAGNYSVIRELPIIIIGAAIPGINSGEALVSFSVDIQAGKNYTSYLIGNTWSDMSLRVMTVED